MLHFKDNIYISIYIYTYMLSKVPEQRAKNQSKVDS